MFLDYQAQVSEAKKNPKNKNKYYYFFAVSFYNFSMTYINICFCFICKNPGMIDLKVKKF